MKTQIVFLLLISWFGSAQAQEGKNLVPNPSFEELEKKPKDKGMIYLAIPWKSASMELNDLFSAEGKSEFVMAPENYMGAEKAMEGSNYAGFRAYSYKGAEARSYIQTELLEPLKAGKTYCVKFYVSLSDLSKYSCNNIGMLFSKEREIAKNRGVLNAEPQVVHRGNGVYGKMFYWEQVCGDFEAKGGEKYITIGNFKEDDATLNEKMKRPTGFLKPQVYSAYYYLDNVSVVELGNNGVCECERRGLTEYEVTERHFASDDQKPSTIVKIVGEKSPEERALNATNKSLGSTPDLSKIEKINIQFDPLKSSIIGGGADELAEVIKILKSSNVKVEIQGHADKSESSMPPLSEVRAKNVYKYLISQGVDQQKLSFKGLGDSQPLDPASKSKNMRATFKILP